MNKYTKSGIGVIFSIALLSTWGCDKVSAISDSFKKSEKKAEKPVQMAKIDTATPMKKMSLQKTDTAGVQKPALKTSSQQGLPPNVLARVGNWTITNDEFNERLQALKKMLPEYDIKDKQSRAMVLEELLRQQLLVEEAEQTGLANDKKIKMAVEEFRRTLIVREAAQRLTKDITVSEEEAKEFYEKNKDALVEPPKWHVREIVFDSQEKANAVLIEILKGVDFVEMVKQHSIGKSAKDEGDLGFITDVPFSQMANPLLSLEPGDVSNVFKGPEGYYIIKLEEKKGGEPLKYEDIKEEIKKNLLLQKQQQAILNHLEELRQKIKVEVNQKLLE